MRRLRRIVAGAAIACLLVPTMAPGAEAATYPRPLAQQWWFTAWAIDNKVWPLTQGEGVTVAVVDSGVQADLPDFSGVVLPGTDTTGGGGDGRTDTDTAAVPGHGTGMASLIAAQGPGTGFLGIAPRAKILPIVGSSMDSVSRGIRYAVDRGAKVINVSQGGAGNCGESLQAAVDYAGQHDAIVVAASGDYGDSSNFALSPADCVGVLAVGAVDNHLKPWSGTERQPYVAIASPGVAVSAVLMDGRVHTSNGGTSGAAALTSGGIALLRSRFPDESRTDILKRVFASLRDAGPSGRDDQTGYGVFRPIYALDGGVANSAAYDRWLAVNTPASQHTPTPTRKLPGDQGGSGKVDIPLIAGLPLVLGLIGVAGAFFLRSRRRRPVPAYDGQTPPLQGPPGQYPQQGPPRPYAPPYAPPPYAPPSYGPPSYGPPPNQGPPPGGGR